MATLTTDRPSTLTGRRGYRWWLSAATLSTLGDSISFFALGWVAAGHGPAAASLVVTMEGIPLVVLILLGGAFADRWGIRRVMVACDAFMALVLATFALGALRGVPVWSLALVGALGGTAAAIRRPAEGVFPRLFASGDELAKTLATTSLALQLARVTGPSVGGVLLGLGSLPLTSGVDALSFACVLAVLLKVRPPHEPPTAPPGGPSVPRRLVDGLVAARRTPGAPAAVLTVCGLAFTVLPLVSLVLPLVGHDRGWPADETGVVAAAWVVGGLLVTLLVRRWGAPTARVALAGPAVAAGGVALLAATTSRPAAFVALTAVGAGTSALTSRLVPRFLTATPPDLLARFQSLLGLAQTGPFLLAAPTLGRLVDVAGARAALWCVAGVLALTCLVAARAEAGLGEG